MTKAFASLGEACEIYTDASIENYASGASTLSCLKLLMAAGVRVFHLEDLHAKILLIPDDLVTIGSQNFTAGGTANLEAGTAWGGGEAVSVAMAQIEPWRKLAKAVTKELVQDIERQLPKLRREHRQWKMRAQAATREVWTTEEARKTRIENERLRQEREAARRSWASRTSNPERGVVARYASQLIIGRVQEANGAYSLIARSGESGQTPSYVRWKDGDKPINLTEAHWYSCYHLDTRQFGRARVFMGRISFIYRHIFQNIEIDAGDSTFVVSLNCISGDADHNAEFRVRSDRKRARILGNYDVDDVSLHAIEPPHSNQSNPFNPSLFQPLLDSLNGNANDEKSDILDRIWMPKRAGSLGNAFRVNHFFQPGQRIYTGLRMIGRYRILLFSSRFSRIEGMKKV